MEKKFFFGKIVKTRGNKGEVLVVLSPDVDLSLFRQGYKFILKSQKHTYEKELLFIKESSKGYIVKFSGVDDINHSFKLVGYNIFTNIPVSSASERNYDGFKVIDMKSDEWGIVEGFEKNGINRMIRVSLNGGVRLIPFTPPIICNIDIVNRVILIDPPEGLKDLN